MNTNRTHEIEWRAKCTTCKKVQVMTDAQKVEAHDIGCAFSRCCGAVATIERVTVKRQRKAAT